MITFNTFLSKVKGSTIKDIYFDISSSESLIPGDDSDRFVIELDDGQLIAFKYLIHEGEEGLELNGEDVIPFAQDGTIQTKAKQTYR